MLKKVYLIEVEHYDYFGGQSSTYHNAYSVADALSLYREKKQYDYDYGDGWTKTYPIRHRFEYVPDQGQRPHARSRCAWSDIQEANERERRHKAGFAFSEEEFAHLFSLIPELVDDGDIII